MANVLRAVPVLEVIDHRRLTLWVAFALVLLGGIGLDGLHANGRGWVWWAGLWCVGAAGLIALAVAIPMSLAPTLRAKALAHYTHAANDTSGVERAVYRDRAERQVESTLRFVPRYAVFGAAQLLALAGLALALRRRRLAPSQVRATLLALTLADLFAFGWGLNPAIARDDDRPEPPIITYLQREAPPPSRVLAIGGELPPNTLMRYGLADVRNYDSIELASNLRHFAPIYVGAGSAGASRTSRREITWESVAHGLDRLRAAGVTAVVGPTPPPVGLFSRVDRVGAVWVGRIAATGRSSSAHIVSHDNGLIRVRPEPGHNGPLRVAETYDPGWRAESDGRALPIRSRPDGFLDIETEANSKTITLRYDPLEVRVGAIVSLLALLSLMSVFVGVPGVRNPRKNAIGSWKPAAPRVTIGSMTSDRSSSPASWHEG